MWEVTLFYSILIRFLLGHDLARAVYFILSFPQKVMLQQCVSIQMLLSIQLVHSVYLPVHQACAEFLVFHVEVRHWLNLICSGPLFFHTGNSHLDMVFMVLYGEESDMFGKTRFFRVRSYVLSTTKPIASHWAAQGWNTPTPSAMRNSIVQHCLVQFLQALKLPS